jgi:hypothetical protein
LIDLYQFTIEPYQLVQDDLVQAKVRARNIVGWSEFSEPNSIGQVIQTRPMTAPPNLIIDFALTNEIQIAV